MPAYIDQVTAQMSHWYSNEAEYSVLALTRRQA